MSHHHQHPLHRVTHYSDQTWACDGCSTRSNRDINKPRWRCTQCNDTDMCQACYDAGTHNNHLLKLVSLTGNNEWYCDKCQGKFDQDSIEGRMRCNKCSDFDYCVSCYDAKLSPVQLSCKEKLIARCQRHCLFDADYAVRVYDEYCKFLALKVALGDYMHEQLSPSVDVDAMWHQHVLDTEAYMTDCKSICGDFIHHNPDGDIDENGCRQSRAAQTMIEYSVRFREKAPADIWNFGADTDVSELTQSLADSKLLTRAPSSLAPIPPGGPSSAPTTTTTTTNTDQYFIKTLTGKIITLNLPQTATILQMKQQIQDKEGIPPDQQTLVFAGQRLNDNASLDHYVIPVEGMIHLILQLRC